MKLTKRQLKIHREVEKVLEKEILTFDEKMFVLENFQEGMYANVSADGAHFTPFLLAQDFRLEIYNDSKIIDLCAGIGALAFFAYHYSGIKDITCVEINADFVRVGKKILPEATWIHSSIFDLDLNNRYDQVISNPPFGNVKFGLNDSIDFNYSGSDFAYKAIEFGSKIAKYGTFILPQGSTPFTYSGKPYFQEKKDNNKYNQFLKETGLNFEFNIGIDTSIFSEEWKYTNITTEIINIDFEDSQSIPCSEPVESESAQLSLF